MLKVPIREWGFVCALVILSCNATTVWGQSTSTAAGNTNALNPKISLNSLFLAQFSDPEQELDGLKVQELELALLAAVDPYFNAKAFIAYEPDSDGPGTGVVIEEAYASTMGLPVGWMVRAGRFLIPFGRHNQHHIHQYPFILPPLAVATILGEESVGDVGLQVDYAPGIPWFMNIQFVLGDGATDELFDGESRSLAYEARIENFWDLSQATSLDLGISGWTGPAPGSVQRTLIGADIRLKYRDPRRTHGHLVDWWTEVLLSSTQNVSDQYGLYTLLRYRFKRNWWMGGMFSWFSNVPEGLSERLGSSEVGGQITREFSEFSSLRANVVLRDPGDSETEVMAQLQFNFTIGAHPAHQY